MPFVQCLWLEVFAGERPLNSLKTFRTAAMETKVPSKVMKNIKRKNPAVTPEIEKALKEKRTALRLLKKQPTDAAPLAFKQKRNLVTDLLRKSKRAHPSSLHRATRLKPSPSASRNFWDNVRVITGKIKHTVIPDLPTPATHPVFVSLLTRLLC